MIDMNKLLPCPFCGGKEFEITELQSHINDLREALQTIVNESHPELWQVQFAIEALAKTPAQSLQEHDNEVIGKYVRLLDTSEYCLIKYCYPIQEGDEVGCILKEISALKGGKWQS